MKTSVRVSQMTNDNYRPVANHFIIEDGDTVYIQSYRSIVVKKEYNKITLGRDWDYSRTTMKYVGQYLGENAKSIRAKIASGEYIYDENMV